MHLDSGINNGNWVVSDPIWSSDGKFIAYLRNDHSSINVWISAADGHMQQQVTHRPGAVQRFTWNDDSSAIVFEWTPHESARTQDSSERDRGYVYDDRFYPFASSKPLKQKAASQLWKADLPTHRESPLSVSEGSNARRLLEGLEVPGHPHADSVS